MDVAMAECASPITHNQYSRRRLQRESERLSEKLVSKTEKERKSPARDDVEEEGYLVDMNVTACLAIFLLFCIFPIASPSPFLSFSCLSPQHFLSRSTAAAAHKGSIRYNGRPLLVGDNQFVDQRHCFSVDGGKEERKGKTAIHCEEGN